MLIKGNNILPKEIRNILLIQLGDIGDVVLTTPTTRALRNNFPASNLVVVTRERSKELLEDSPWVSRVVPLKQKNRKLGQEIAYQKSFFSQLRKNNFDVAIELRTGTRGAIISYLSGALYRIGRFADDGKLWRNRVFTHLVRPTNELNQYSAEHSLNILAPFNLKIESRTPELFVSAEKQRRADLILKHAGVHIDDPIIAVQPFALWKYKEWGMNKYVKLIDFIGTEYGFPILLTGSAEEMKRAEELANRCRVNVHNLAGRTSIGEYAGLLKACSLLIGGDSGGIHVAAAVGTPTVSIFGPSSALNWAPKGSQHHVIHKDWSCVPCRRMECEYSDVSKCLEELSVEEVISVIKNRVLVTF
jgi:heptosyltransferase-3